MYRSLTKGKDGVIRQATPEAPSRRKPHSWWAGYVAERRNYITGEYNVLVEAKAQGLDPDGGRWNVICTAHSTILSHTNQRMLRAFALRTGYGSLEWCDDCRAVPYAEYAIKERRGRRRS